MKDLSYYSIMYGGVPLTPMRRIRAIRMALLAGHNEKEVLTYFEVKG